MRIALLAATGLGCSSPVRPPVAPPTALPAASTACYAGLAKGMQQKVRTVLRRTVEPAQRRIVEEVTREAAGADAVQSFQVVLRVEGDQLTMTETAGAFTGTGSLSGDPWRWTAWTTTYRIADKGVEVQSERELTGTGLATTTTLTKAGAVVGTVTEELAQFECAEYASVKAALAFPAADASQCDQACRNFATLNYWQAADAAIASSAPADREALRTQKTAEFARNLESGIASCVQQCESAGNAKQTSCLVDAKTADQLQPCFD